jgi:flagellar biosynthesis protein FlhB
MKVYIDSCKICSLQNNKKILKINLQLFADSGDKTEKATPKRRQKAREEGQVLQSKELTSSIILLCMFVTIKIAGSTMFGELKVFFERYLYGEYKLSDIFQIDGLANLYMDIFMTFLRTVAPVFAVAVLVTLICEYAQVGFLFTTKTLAVKLSKLNPLNGLKRMFSVRSMVELVKSIIKIVIIGVVGYTYLWGEANNVVRTMDMDVVTIASYIADTSLNVAIRMCVAVIILGAFDYLYQWWEYEKSLKMSKHDIKQEFKEAEGNQEVKSKIRQKQRQMSMKRMMQEVPKADVVITNPTHFAVAIQYDAKASEAPIVVAKGQDYIALRMREIAKEHRIELYENKPLARTLYETCEVGEKIPPDLYQAVAEVLAFVYALKN